MRRRRSTSDEAKAAEQFALNAVVDVTLPAAAVFLRPKLKVRLRCVGPSAYAPVFDPFHAGGADAPAAPDAPLAAGDVVRIARPRGDKTLDADLDGRRARVVEPSDAIRPNHAVVEIEATAGSSGRELLPLPHRALARVDAASLAKKPFREPKKKRKRESDGGGARKRASEPARPRAPPWLVVGIKVRVARDGDPRFRCKGRVLDVLMGDGGALRATLALENGDRVDEPGLREKHLETALPKDGGAVRAVLGPRKNALGTLLARDKRKEQATVRFDDDDGIDVLPFDHVAEWCGER